MKLAAAAAIAAGIGCIAGSAAVLAFRSLPPSQEALAGKVNTRLEPVWNDAAWPFQQDQWNAGRAFVCQPADCGVRVELYLRPKIGFCNCSTGVSDDSELERVSDTGLLSREVAPAGSGHPIKVAWMDGRSRAYRSASGANLLSVAVNDECDAVVAVARLEHGDPAVIEPAVLKLLNTRPVVLWTKKELGLEFVKRDW